MPANRSADGLRRASRVRTVLRSASFTSREKLLLLALNAWPLLHVGAILCVLTLPSWSLGWRVAGALGGLLLLPPLLGRLVLLRQLPSGEIPVPSSAFFRWWATWQLQMLFNRLPWLEEMLRLVPGAYSLWLRLWGARIGRLTLWSPGCRIFDRPLVRIGDDAVVGVDVRFVSHFGSVDADGRSTFVLGPITVGHRATLGAAALLGPGVVVDADQCTEALFLGTPFTHWRGGERVSPAATSRVETAFVSDTSP